MNTKYENYINFICDLLTIRPVKVHFREKNHYFDQHGKKVKPFDLKESAGATTIVQKATVYMDLNKYQDGFEYVALAHEIRHIFQYQALYEDYDLREDVLDDIAAWKRNFEHYMDSTNPEYVNQPLEMDANAFAWAISRIIFGREVMLHSGDQSLFDRYKQMICEVYTADEILECARFNGISNQFV